MDPTPWSAGLITSISALSVGGLAAVLGLWIGRDKSRPVGFSIAMTVLILSAVSVGCVQSYLDAVEMIKKRADLEKMMNMVTEIAVATGDEDLAKLIEEESGAVVDIPEPQDTAPPVIEEPVEGTPAAEETE